MYNVINKLLSPNQWSRPQKSLNGIKAIVIHWVANPMSTATGNRDYFESRKSGTLDYGSAHEVIDLNGDIIVCVPENEITYNCGSATYTQRCLNELGGSPNYCTYGIECTHTDWNGTMTPATYNTLVERCADLCIRFHLNPIIALWTHKEVVGWKDCHLWFVKNPIEWTMFKQRVADMIATKTIPQWQYDCLIWMKSKGIITSDHSPIEPVTMGLFGYMMNNYLTKIQTIEPIAYLTANGYIKSLHDAKEVVSLRVFAFMMANRANEGTSDPIGYLTQKGFLSAPSTRNADEIMTFAVLGAMLKNASDKNIKI